MKRSGLFLVCTALAAAAAQAQTPSGAEWPYEEVISRSELPNVFDPATFGMAKIADGDDLYALLTSPDRCPVGKTQSPRTPCALISYAPPGTLEDAYGRSLRPIFKVVSRDKIWTFLNGRLAQARIDDLEHASDLSDANEARSSYEPTALVGNKENEKNCARSRGRTCVDDAHFSFFLKRKDVLTPGCVEEIWKPRGGPRDPGSQSRCRFDIPSN